MSDQSHHQSANPPEIVEQLRQEFVDEALDRLQTLDVVLDGARHGRGNHAEIITAFRRTALLLRGQASNFGCGPLAVVAHRLDEYLCNAPEVLPPRSWDDLQKFLDLMQSLTECRQSEREDASSVVRSLPIKLGFDTGDIQVRNVEIMLVMPHGAQTRFVERELQQCGYRVSIVPDTILAFAMATQTLPNMIIVSALMPRLDGIDLAIALTAMPATRNIPIAVITSLDKDDARLQMLPRKIPVVYKGSSFGDDLFKALDSLFLI